MAARPLADYGDELRLRCRVRLLTLAGDLADQGIRARLPDPITPPYVLRSWNPGVGGPTFEVACGPGEHGRLEFRDQASGAVLADAEEALEPGDTVDLARAIARELEPQRRSRS